LISSLKKYLGYRVI